MIFFYKVLDEEILEMRNEIFINRGLSALQKHGFVELPFLTACFGKDDYGDYTYNLCRLSGNHLEKLSVDIVKGDRWIKVYLNIFSLRPTLDSIKSLQKVDGLQYVLPPNSKTEMRLREDDFKGMPLFNFVHHCIGSYATEAGFKRRLKQLGDLIERDMENINSFVQRWHELHTPLVTDWEGHVIEKDESDSGG